MAAAEFALSPAALSALQVWLPGDLTETQTDKIIKAATSMGAEVWAEGARAAITIDRMRREARQNETDPS